jgi:hypothetical protein
MSQDWREFERLVAKIEGALAPVGAVVKTPDWIKPNIPGRKRQVDASIRCTVGSVPILITVECRKRKDKQDVTWIEQLVTKKQNIKAAKTVAVTAEGISEQATQLARIYGIEVRKMSEIAYDDIRKWIMIESIEHVAYRSTIERAVTPQLCPEAEDYGEPVPNLHPTVLGQMNSDAAHSRVFVRHSDSKSFSLKDIVNAAEQHGLNIYHEIPLDGTVVRRDVDINFSRGQLSLLTQKGPRDVICLHISLDVYATVLSIPLSEFGCSYTGENTPAVYGVETSIDVLGRDTLISIMR